MNKSSGKDCLSIQYSYEMSAGEFLTDSKLMHWIMRTSCIAPNSLGSF